MTRLIDEPGFDIIDVSPALARGIADAYDGQGKSLQSLSQL